MLIISPTVWEWDGPTDFYRRWNDIIRDVFNQGYVRDFVLAALSSPDGIPSGHWRGPVFRGFGRYSFSGPFSPFGLAMDRPVGVGAGLSPANLLFTPSMMLLTPQMARRATTLAYSPEIQITHGNLGQTVSTDRADSRGVVPLSFRDAEQFAGEYIVMIRVEAL